MGEEEAEHQDKTESGKVVYQRSQTEEEPISPAFSSRYAIYRPAGQIAPALQPLLIGFAVLLMLVLALGLLSVRRVDQVSSEVLSMQQQFAAKLSYLLDLRFAVLKLDGEARQRATIEATLTLKPPDTRLNRAQKDVRAIARRLETPPFNQFDPAGDLKRRIDEFVALTEDRGLYQSDGFPKFRDLDAELRRLLDERLAEQNAILQRAGSLQGEATRRIYLLTLVALMVGALVTAATGREVQKRFRQMRESLEIARRERQFSNQMLEGMVSAVAAIDSNDRIRSANHAFFEIFPGAAIGSSVHDSFGVPPEAAQMLRAAVSDRVHRSTYRGRWVANVDSSNGSVERSFDIYCSPLEVDAGEGKIITLVDVSEAVEAEAIARRTESLAAVGQAAAQVSHEIKNPLGSIRLGVAMLRDMTRDREALGTIELVERGINHLNKLVVDVNEFSRQKELSRSDVRLSEVIDASLELAGEQISLKQTPVSKVFAREELRGFWDPDQLQQVFVNLIVNAVDASEERSPIYISTSLVTKTASTKREGDGHAANEGDAYARIVIEDKGKGMDEATKAKIFTPFFSTKRRGTGLGLAIVKQIVERHGGEVAVESTAGQGTKFIMDLPL